MTSANLIFLSRGEADHVLCVGNHRSAIGGLLRYIITRLTLNISVGLPYGTILINVLGSFVIGYFGTLTLQSGKYPASDNLRLFVMVGICGGFTTFSSF